MIPRSPYVFCFVKVKVCIGWKGKKIIQLNVLNYGRLWFSLDKKIHKEKNKRQKTQLLY